MVRNEAPAQAGFTKRPVEGYVKSYEVIQKNGGDDGKEVLGKERLKVVIDKDDKEVQVFLDLGNVNQKFCWKDEYHYTRENGSEALAWVPPWSAEYTSLKKVAAKAGIKLIEDIDEIPEKKIDDNTPSIQIVSITTDPGEPSLINKFIKISVVEGGFNEQSGKEYPDRYVVAFIGDKAPNAQKTLDDTPKATVNAPPRRSREEAQKVDNTRESAPREKAPETETTKTKSSKAESKKAEFSVTDDLLTEVNGYINKMLNDTDTSEMGIKMLQINMNNYEWSEAGTAAFVKAPKADAYNNLNAAINTLVSSGVLLMDDNKVSFKEE